MIQRKQPFSNQMNSFFVGGLLWVIFPPPLLESHTSSIKLCLNCTPCTDCHQQGRSLALVALVNFRLPLRGARLHIRRQENSIHMNDVWGVRQISPPPPPKPPSDPRILFYVRAARPLGCPKFVDSRQAIHSEKSRKAFT